MGGVIVDVHYDRSIQYFQAIGVNDADQHIGACHHKGLYFAFENGDIDTAEFCRLLCDHAGKSIQRERIEEAWRSMIDPPQAYKLDYLQELRKKYRLFLLTNNNPVIMDWACTLGFASPGKALNDYFDKIYMSYQMKCMKPHPVIYQMMIEDAGINPAESLFIDDSELNIQGAESCGLSVLHVKNGTDWREEANLMING